MDRQVKATSGERCLYIRYTRLDRSAMPQDGQVMPELAS